MTPDKTILERWLPASVAELELSIRATNCLDSEGISTVKDLVIRTDEELLEIRNFGETTLREVKESLRQRGLHLGMKLANSTLPAVHLEPLRGNRAGVSRDSR